MHRIRLLFILIKFLFRKGRSKYTDTFTIHLRVTPFDLELIRQNSHTYFSMMALGRWHFVLHLLDWKAAFKEKWGPLTYSEHCRFIRALKLFDRVSLETRLVQWDRKMVYLEHKFIREGKLVAIGHSRGAMYGVNGYLKPCESLKALPSEEFLPHPELVQVWDNFDAFGVPK